MLMLTFAAPLAYAAGGSDILLALDHSLSMNNNDPGRESLAGAELFTELLGADNRLALMTFARSVQLITPLTPAEQARGRILVALRRIRMDGVRTDFETLLREGYAHLLDKAAESGAGGSWNGQLILFTDGQLNLGNEADNVTARAAILDDWLPRFAAAGIRIHGLAFSPGADLDLLRELAEATGGQAFQVENPRDLQAAFLRLFEQTDQPSSLPVTDGRLEVDASVKELRLLVPSKPDGEPVRLSAPGNERLQASDRRANLDWKRTQRFDHITITQPRAGSWRVEGGAGEPRAYIESDLDLDVILPVMATRDEEVLLVAQLLYKGIAVDPSALGAIEFSAEILDSSGAPHDPVVLRPRLMDAEVREAILGFDAAGSYQVRVMARGPGFERSKIAHINILASAARAAPVAREPVRLDEHGRPLPFWFQEGGGDEVVASEAAPSVRRTLSEPASSPDLDPLSAPVKPHQKALAILLATNLAIVVVLGAVLAYWWRARRQSSRSREPLDGG
ncbi:MAG: VWA domain-containing protein [Chromatiaceae bacterium]|nr:VWA domain-containing protein [Chromatiaceae bacterium]